MKRFLSPPTWSRLSRTKQEFLLYHGALLLWGLTWFVWLTFSPPAPADPGALRAFSERQAAVPAEAAPSEAAGADAPQETGDRTDDTPAERIVTTVYIGDAAYGYDAVTTAPRLAGMTVIHSRDDARDAANALRDAVERAAGNPVTEIYYDDFDGDGTCEAFATVAAPDRDPEDLFYDDLFYDVDMDSFWYARDDRVMKLMDRSLFSMRGIVKLGTQKCLLCENYAVVCSDSELWTVQDGTPKILRDKIFRSNEGDYDYRVTTDILAYPPEYLTQVNERDFYFNGNAYDATFEVRGDDWGDDWGDLGSGHTWNRYYLYWTENGFREYGGTPVSESWLRAYRGADAILDAIGEDERVTDIFYRANGIVNINRRYYYYDDNGEPEAYDCANITLKIDGNSVHLAENPNAGLSYDYGYSCGIYRAAYYPDIATYPKVPKPGAAPLAFTYPDTAELGNTAVWVEPVSKPEPETADSPEEGAADTTAAGEKTEIAAEPAVAVANLADRTDLYSPLARFGAEAGCGRSLTCEGAFAVGLIAFLPLCVAVLIGLWRTAPKRRRGEGREG